MEQSQEDTEGNLLEYLGGGELTKGAGRRPEVILDSKKPSQRRKMTTQLSENGGANIFVLRDLAMARSANKRKGC